MNRTVKVGDMVDCVSPYPEVAGRSSQYTSLVCLVQNRLLTGRKRN